MKTVFKNGKFWGSSVARFRSFGKRRVCFVVLLVVGVILSGIGLVLAVMNHSRDLASQAAKSQPPIAEEGEKQPTDVPPEMLLAESQSIIQSDSVVTDGSDETGNEDNDTQISGTKNGSIGKSVNPVPAVKSGPGDTADPDVRIKCSIKAKRGSRDSRAIISWDCEHYVGWSCDLQVQTTNKPYKNVILPKSSQEVKVMTEHMELVPYCSQIGCPAYEKKVPGYTYYWLICKSNDGRKKNFDGLYTQKD